MSMGETGDTPSKELNKGKQRSVEWETLDLRDCFLNSAPGILVPGVISPSVKNAILHAMQQSTTSGSGAEQWGSSTCTP